MRYRGNDGRCGVRRHAQGQRQHWRHAHHEAIRLLRQQALDGAQVIGRVGARLQGGLLVSQGAVHRDGMRVQPGLLVVESLDGQLQTMGRVLIAQRVRCCARHIGLRTGRLPGRRRGCRRRRSNRCLPRGMNARELLPLRSCRVLSAVGVRDRVDAGVANRVDGAGTHGNSLRGRGESRRMA